MLKTIKVQLATEIIEELSLIHTIEVLRNVGGVWIGQVICSQVPHKLVFSVGESPNWDLAISLCSLGREGVFARWLLKDVKAINREDRSILIEVFGSESRTMLLTISIGDGLVETFMPAENQDR